uniref:B30.2/SPRY domain-containing protein n=1 Tax=Astyanax mexicanus TaxID=7994 RepID=A0A8B9H4D4_ASTMX
HICKSRPGDYTDVSSKLKDSLKEEFERILDGNSLTGHRRYLNEVYTELYIVENETGGVIQGHEVRQMEAVSSRSAGKDVPIECNNIFKVQADGKRNKKVLTMGIAGVVNKFILDWSEGKDNKDIAFIFPLPFRELNLRKEEKLSLIELLQECLPGSTMVDSLPQGDGKILFVFDGLDECRFHLNFNDSDKLKDVNQEASVGAIITNLIRRDLLPSALVWITSRPAAAYQIPRDHIDQVTEVRGFNDNQKEEYFNKYCGTDVGSTIFTHIRKSRSLYIMCHIPVFCWISATALHSLSQEEDSKTPTTLTGMYIHFLVQQANQVKKKYDGSPQDIILKLAELAFYQLEKGNLIFYKEDLEACGIDVNEGSIYSGLCTQIFKMEKKSSEQMVFSFVHLSVQEALAAIYVFYCHKHYKKNVFIQDLKHKFKWLLRRSSYRLHKSAVERALQSKNGHLDLFLRFLLGLSVKSNERSLEELLPGLRRTSGRVQKTINYIKDKIRLSESSERTFNLFHCLSELEDDSIISEVQNFLNSGDLSMMELSSTQWLALVFVLLMSDETQEMFELRKYRESDDGLRRLLPVVKNTKRALLDCCHITEVSCELLASVLKSHSSYLLELDLSNNNLQDSGVELLSEGLKSSHCKLQILKLDCCHITEVSCGILALVLKSHSSYLIELDLSNNDLQDSGVELLSEGLKSSHCKLQILKLSGCMVTEKGCFSLALALSSNPSHLRELDLSYNHPGESGRGELNERLETANFKLQILTYVSSERIKPGLQKYARKLTLDPNTAHVDLSLSKRNRTVKWTKAVKENPQSPDHPERFDTWCQVLCRESLSGRCYWEVQWSDMGVHIGVTYRGIGRKGGGNECWFGQNDQSWSLDCTKVNYTARHNSAKTIISAEGRCSYKIGVYLDCSAGRLSFYDVSSNNEQQKLAHLHTFNATFTEPLYTGFMVTNATVTLCNLDYPLVCFNPWESRVQNKLNI